MENDTKPDCRIYHEGRNGIAYEEWRDGDWQRIILAGEPLIGRPYHVIYFRSKEEWLKYPEWARHRRDEIIARVKDACREPDFEYNGG